MPTEFALPARVRLAELVAALSLGVDLGFGQPMEHVLRQCLIALAIAERLGLEDEERAVVYYTALLIMVGCHTDAHEQAKWFGDDMALKGLKYEHGLHSVSGAVASMRMLGQGNPPLHRFRVGLEYALSGHRDVDTMVAGHAQVARKLAERLSLPAGVQEALGAAYEQWDGRGWPGDLRADEVPLAARVSQFAEYVEVAHRLGGVPAACELAESRRGSQFDPALSDLLVRDGDQILSGLRWDDTWDAVISSEPSLTRTMSGADLDRALVAVADFVDLKSPYTLGHGRAVSELSAAAASKLGLGESESDDLRRAALVQGLGRMGVSNAIWDKPAPLGAGEWERVRLHPYLTERMLEQSPGLAPLGAIAVQLRERLDGSGYPRRLSGPAISRSARVLGAADAYQSMREPRPHREPLSPEAAANELEAEVRAGRLDREAVDAVLASAGHRVGRRREGPAGLTKREVEVLQLLARGKSSKQISSELTISHKTARNHIEHIYTKIGANTRVTASWFAVQHGLLPENELGVD
jgi:HD-GYP domain-containing protein (c-di-GMP phosphodiesterase class II)